MPDHISLRCPGRWARLRAARALLNRTCPCPRCQRRVLVRPPPPGDSGVAPGPDNACGAPRA